MVLKVTVGVIARNEESHIKEVINSLIKQSFDHNDFEIILVDGNSTDNTREYADKLLSDSKISYKILNEKDFGFYGPCFARNIVVKNSSEESKYIAYIDADCVADKNWLKRLYEKIKNSDKSIAGAGGARYIAKTNNKKEIIINSVLTSFIAMGGNPAFSKRKIKYIKSIANYNAIYKKDILKKNPYDNSLIISDDVDLNFRLGKMGYKFLYVSDAIVYHHETNSIKQFAKDMIKYGRNISNVIKKHKSCIRFYVPLTVLFLFGPIMSLIWIIIAKMTFRGVLSNLVFIPAAVYAIYIIFLIAIFFEIVIRTKDFARSLFVFIMIPMQHFCYGWGVLTGVCSKRNPFERKGFIKKSK